MTDTNYALTHLYHPTGCKVDVPLSLMETITAEQAARLIISVDALIAAGFAVNLPGLLDGELVDEFSAVARRTSNDGVPIVAFYKDHPRLVKKFLHAYLDTAEDVAAFEEATGLRLATIPVFESDKDVTKDHAKASQYIVNLRVPVKAVYRVTDRWKQWDAAGGSGQQPQKYELLRYMTNGHIAAPQNGDRDYSQVKTPGGLLVSSLDDDKLRQLVTGTASWITDDMRQAAKITLKSKGK